MLSSLTIKNWASFESVSLDRLDLYDTISVEGETGSGKSSLFEAVYFVIYGKARVPNAMMVRDNATDNMEVKATFVGFPKPKDTIEITRGLKGSTGYASLFLNGEEKAVNSEVAVWFEKNVGSDSEDYLLTQFFGFDGRDKLLGVTSSQRLDTLQNILRIEEYSKFYDKAKSESANLKTELSELKGHIAANNQELLSRIKASPNSAQIKTEIESKTKELSILQSQLSELSFSSEKLTAFDIEKRTLLNNLKSLEKDLGYFQGELDNELEEKEEASSSLKKLVAERASINIKDLQKAKQEIDKQLQTLTTEIASGKQTNDLRIIGVETFSGQHSEDGVGECPLCESELSTDIIPKWEQEIASFSSELANKESLEKDLISKSEKLVREVRMADKREERIADLKDRIKVSAEREKSLLKRIDEKQKEKTSTDVKVLSLNNKIAAIGDIEVVNKQSTLIGKMQEELGQLRQRLETAKEEERKKKQLQTLILSQNKQVKTLENTLAAYGIVEEGFSRYGIPLRLISNFLSELTESASEVFSFFGYEKITSQIIEERGNPGIEFQFHTETGARYYNQLSTGQKAIAFFSLRIALSEILRLKGRFKSNFLLLDELTGHLSKDKRDLLMKYIRSKVAKSYDQIFMTSHTEIRDIFSAKIRVIQEEGISEIEFQAG